MVPERLGILMKEPLRKAIGQFGISLVLLTVGASAADALTGTAGTVGISEHDEATPRESGEGQDSGDENPDQYQDSEVGDDEKPNSNRDETLIDLE
jgi:hypothetical protein